MAFVNITCPKCNTVGQMSLLDPNFKGMYRCWKCREFCNIVLENNTVKSCVLLTSEEVEKQVQLRNLQEKFRKGYK